MYKADFWDKPKGGNVAVVSVELYLRNDLAIHIYLLFSKSNIFLFGAANGSY